ncbi:MAG: Rrf2 family transcriptional regulator [bacterium]|nr:Rrf2 family transcriptional regulator [bacterium]
MACLLRISEAASLAIHTVVYLAAHPERLVSTKEIARVLHASDAHLSKVLQRLARVGLVRSIRGPHGGFTLLKAPGKIALLEVYEAIEGPINSSVCLLEQPACKQGRCVMGTILREIYQEVEKYLARTTIANLKDIFASGR